MSGIFEVYRDGGRRYRFRLKNVAGRVIALSEAYSTKDDAITACRDVQGAAPSAGIVDLTA